MNLEIPEGANVHIFIGKAPLLALTDERAEPHKRARGRGILGAAFKITAVCLIVFGGFWVGEQRGQAANEDGGIAAPPPVTQAFPSQAAVGPSPAGPGQVPPSFQAQLQQQPSIQLAPGQAPSAGNSAKNPFGLGD